MAFGKSSVLRAPSALRSGLLTGLAQVVVALAAAGAGALLAHKFGRTAETDGFLAGYGVYLVLVLAAQAFRMVVVPDLTRAAAEGRLGGESRAYALAFLALAVPVSVLVAVLSHPLGDLITGSLPPRSAHIAARALVVLVPAAFVQLLAALAASALAALDSYGTAAAGFACGGLAGLVVFAALADAHGIVALAWGLSVNALVALAVPLVVLLRRGALGGPSAAQARHRRRGCGASFRAPRSPSRSRAATCSRCASRPSSGSAGSRASRMRISPPRRSSVQRRSRSA